jgi:hypothetical protein
MDLVPVDIALVIGLGPHNSEFAIRYRSVAMVDKALFRQSEMMGASDHYQADDAKTGQGFGHFFNHIRL